MKWFADSNFRKILMFATPYEIPSYVGSNKEKQPKSTLFGHYSRRFLLKRREYRKQITVY